MYCEHNHLIDQCEVCNFTLAVERGEIVVRTPTALASLSTDRPRVRVTEDTVIERSDLGEGVETFVAAGDAVPLDLEDLPRHPRETAPAAEPAKRRRRTA